MLLDISILNADTPTTIYSPRGSAINSAWFLDELSPSGIQYWNNWVATYYPNATRLTDASRTYNCHAYAWHKIEGGNTVWLDTPGDDVYWEDGSYINVSSESEGTKVSYKSDDHSAVTTGTPGIFISKWGAAPVMQHAYNYTPYDESEFEYYVVQPFTTSAVGTANNGKNNLIKYNGAYHFVFESGNKIYYTNTNNQGLRWSLPKVISEETANITRRYPAIAERDGNLYVVWKEFQPDYYSSGYNRVKFRCYYYGSWQAIQSLFQYTLYSTEFESYPTIAVSKTGTSFEMTVAYKIPWSGSTPDLNTRSSTSVTGASWSNESLVTGSDNAESFSLAYTSGMPYTRIVWSNGAHIYTSSSYYTYGIGWSSPNNISSQVEVNRDSWTNRYPTLAVSGNGSVYTAWEGDDLLGYDVIYWSNLNPNVYHEFGNYNAYLKPVLTGHSGSGASLMWYDASYQSYIRKAHYDGTNWDAGMGWWGEGWGEVIAQNGKHPTVSISNPPGSSAKAYWINGSSSPYTLLNGPNAGLQKSNQSPGIYHRRIICKTDDGEKVLAIELGELKLLTETGEEIQTDFDSISVGTSRIGINEGAKYLRSVKLSLPSNINEISFFQTLYSEGLSDSVRLEYHIVESSTDKILGKISFGKSSFNKEQTIIKSNLANLKNREIILRPLIVGLEKEKMNVTLVHVHLDKDVATMRKIQEKNIYASVASIPERFSLSQNYPNPFNPTTIIKYDIPQAGFVSLKVYDVLGKEIATLTYDMQSAGSYETQFDATKLSSGVYFYMLSAGNFMQTKKMQILK